VKKASRECRRRSDDAWDSKVLGGGADFRIQRYHLVDRLMLSRTGRVCGRIYEEGLVRCSTQQQKMAISQEER